MHIGRTRSVSGIGALSAACVNGNRTGTDDADGHRSAAQADTVKFYNGGDHGYTGAV